ncbi:hypothetical protein S245_048859 [Arachis hypogaea]
MPICKLRLRTIEVTTTRLLQSVLSSNSSLLSSLRTIEATTTNRAAHRHRIPQPPRPAATAATDLTTAATTTAASCHRIPQPPRFSVRSMAHSASPFNKITIQRDNTVSLLSLSLSHSFSRFLVLDSESLFFCVHPLYKLCSQYHLSKKILGYQMQYYSVYAMHPF